MPRPRTGQLQLQLGIYIESIWTQQAVGRIPLVELNELLLTTPSVNEGIHWLWQAERNSLKTESLVINQCQEEQIWFQSCRQVALPFLVRRVFSLLSRRECGFKRPFTLSEYERESHVASRCVAVHTDQRKFYFRVPFYSV